VREHFWIVLKEVMTLDGGEEKLGRSEGHRDEAKAAGEVVDPPRDVNISRDLKAERLNRKLSPRVANFEFVERRG